MKVRLVAALLLIAVSSPCHAEDAPSAQQGEQIYAENCSTCHGEDLINNSHIAFDLRRLGPDEHDRFVNSVQHGKNAMPPYVRANADK
jgi:mono/diheme cytochrome c family protein